MAVTIEVRKFDASRFRVRVIEGGSESSHQVTLSAQDCARLTGGISDAEQLIRNSFQFLLDHEPKESILARFDISSISRYFPDYEQEIKRSLGK